MSTISSITLLKKFNVKQLGDLEEKVVELGMDEVCWSLLALFLSLCIFYYVFWKTIILANCWIFLFWLGCEIAQGFSAVRECPG